MLDRERPLTLELLTGAKRLGFSSRPKFKSLPYQEYLAEVEEAEADARSWVAFLSFSEWAACQLKYHSILARRR